MPSYLIPFSVLFIVLLVSIGGMFYVAFVLPTAPMIVALILNFCNVMAALIGIISIIKVWDR